MDKKIGIIGCQSKHAEFFGSLFNVQKVFPGYRAEFIFGDDEPDRMPYVIDTAKIDNICENVDELIEKSDAVLITYRLGKRHFEPAMACIKARKPVFIDKPFTMTSEEAYAIVEASKTQGVVVQGGSTLCFDPQMDELMNLSKRSSFGLIAYRATLDSLFDGYRFYGSHLTDLCAAIFGLDALSVRSYRFDDNVNHMICYPNCNVILHSTPDFKKPQVILNVENSLITTSLDDSQCYFNGMKTFIIANEKGEMNSLKLDQFIFSTRLLEAIMESLETGDEICFERP